MTHAHKTDRNKPYVVVGIRDWVGQLVAYRWL